MDYARFVRLRRTLWDAFERQLAASRNRRGLGYGDLEEMALHYRQVLHDHALAGSRFPGTAAARRLQGLALEGTRRLTGESGERRAGLIRFFSFKFPQAFQRQLGATGVALALFVLGTLWGLALGILRPGLGVTLLGPESIRGLEEGRLWTESLVTTVPPGVSSSGIATNNITVALTAWAGGVLAGFVPLYVLLFNGLLLGALVGVTMHYAMAGLLLEFIAAHGPLELTLIIVSAAAGLAIGRSLIAAGDRPRALALRDASRDALTVLLGCVPWFVVLALVEVFVSPQPALPVVLKVTLGLALESLFLAMAFRPVSSEPIP